MFKIHSFKHYIHLKFSIVTNNCLGNQLYFFRNIILINVQKYLIRVRLKFSSA